MATRNLVAALLLAVSPLAAFSSTPGFAADTTSQTTAEVRAVTSLDTEWEFKFGNAPDNVAEPDFDASGWEHVSVPHSWNRIGDYGTQRSAGSNNQQGIGWYRLRFIAPPAEAGLRQYLDFAAVAKIADVWVNGKHVGSHKGAFARFRFDVTEVWKPGQSNLIVVRADNSKPEPGSSTSEVIPLAGDFFVHGGVYRSVSLLQLPESSIDPLDFGGPGVYARATSLTDDRADIEVLTRLRNVGKSKRKLTLTTEIRDNAGKIVAHGSRSVSLVTGASEVRTQLVVTHPHRWNGRADPYLYHVVATLSDHKTVLDRVTQPLGLRTFSFDADAGFFLNGKHLKLHGVSRHQDILGAGWGMTNTQQAADMALVEELGANTVRQAHYQHADAWSDEADRSGMVVWAELPYVTTPSLSGGKGSDALWANAEQQLREQIRQNYNHPSVSTSSRCEIGLWHIRNNLVAGPNRAS